MARSPSFGITRRSSGISGPSISGSLNPSAASVRNFARGSTPRLPANLGNLGIRPEQIGQVATNLTGSLATAAIGMANIKKNKAKYEQAVAAHLISLNRKADIAYDKANSGLMSVKLDNELKLFTQEHPMEVRDDILIDTAATIKQGLIGEALGEEGARPHMLELIGNKLDIVIEKWRGDHSRAATLKQTALNQEKFVKNKQTEIADFQNSFKHSPDKPGSIVDELNALRNDFAIFTTDQDPSVRTVMEAERNKIYGDVWDGVKNDYTAENISAIESITAWTQGEDSLIAKYGSILDDQIARNEIDPEFKAQTIAKLRESNAHILKDKSSKAMTSFKSDENVNHLLMTGTHHPNLVTNDDILMLQVTSEIFPEKAVEVNQVKNTSAIALMYHEEGFPQHAQGKSTFGAPINSFSIFTRVQDKMYGLGQTPPEFFTAHQDLPANTFFRIDKSAIPGSLKSPAVLKIIDDIKLNSDDVLKDIKGGVVNNKLLTFMSLYDSPGTSLQASKALGEDIHVAMKELARQNLSGIVASMEDKDSAAVQKGKEAVQRNAAVQKYGDSPSADQIAEFDEMQLYMEDQTIDSVKERLAKRNIVSTYANQTPANARSSLKLTRAFNDFRDRKPGSKEAILNQRGTFRDRMEYTARSDIVNARAGESMWVLTNPEVHAISDRIEEDIQNNDWVTYAEDLNLLAEISEGTPGLENFSHLAYKQIRDMSFTDSTSPLNPENDFNTAFGFEFTSITSGERSDVESNAFNVLMGPMPRKNKTDLLDRLNRQREDKIDMDQFDAQFNSAKDIESWDDTVGVIARRIYRDDWDSSAHIEQAENFLTKAAMGYMLNFSDNDGQPIEMEDAVKNITNPFARENTIVKADVELGLDQDMIFNPRSGTNLNDAIGFAPRLRATFSATDFTLEAS